MEGEDGEPFVSPASGTWDGAGGSVGGGLPTILILQTLGPGLALSRAGPGAWPVHEGGAREDCELSGLTPPLSQ